MKYQSQFKNWKLMFRFIIKREKTISLIWFCSLVVLTILVLPVQVKTYLEQDTQMIYNNPVIIALTGPIYGDSLVSRITGEMLLFTLVAIAIMNIFLVVRQTRKDEELNRTEVLRSLPIGRLSIIFSTWLYAFILNIIFGLAISIGYYVVNVEGSTLLGSLLYGLAISFTGIVFASITCLVTQLFQASKTAVTVMMVFLTISFLLRAIGDIGWLNGNQYQESLSYLSLLGIVLRVSPFVDNQIWPLLILLVISLITIVIAIKLNYQRDLDQGLIATKPGNAYAKFNNKYYLTHTLNQLKTSIIIWLTSIFVITLVYGSVMKEIEEMIATNEYLQQMLGGYGLEAYLGMVIKVTIIIAIAPILQIMLRVISEENQGRLEMLLSTPVTRFKIFITHLLIAIGMACLVLLVSFLGFAISSSLTLDNPLDWWLLFKMTSVYLFAIIMMLAITVLIIGWFEDKTYWVWSYLGVIFIITFIGNLLNLPDWTKYLIPFGYIPDLSNSQFQLADFVKIMILVVLSGNLIFFGYKRYKIRDLRSS